MIEIDCRKSDNLQGPPYSCKVYGPECGKATRACIADQFKNYHPKKETPAEIATGATVWVIVRDVDNTAVEMVGYIFLARVEGAVIVTPRVNTYDLADIMQYHIEQTAEMEEAELAVYPVEDCYTTWDDAMAAFTRETEA